MMRWLLPLCALSVLLLGGCASRYGSQHELLAPGYHYTVQRGDTLAAIAAANRTTVYKIITHNNLYSSDVREGEVLFLPDAVRSPERALPTSTERLPYQLVRRRAWGALPARANHDPMRGIGRITLHHTDEFAGMNQLSDLEVVQRIAAYHRDTRNWADIGYHYLVGRDGRIYEGRPLSMQGAHCGGSNNCHNIGISLIGDFTRREPAGVQAKAAQALITQLQQRYRIDASQVLGHRDYNGALTNSTCPGDGGYRWLQHFRSTAALRFPAPAPEGETLAHARRVWRR